LAKSHLSNFDEKNPEHIRLLQRLWCASFSDKPFQGVISEQWKEIGFQVRGIFDAISRKFLPLIKEVFEIS
jgi:hypothetical protein